jgi:hypothetical protein
VALSHVLPSSHVMPCFPILILSSLHLVIFKHPYLTHMNLWSLILEIFSDMNSALQFLHIYHSDFHLKKNPLPSNFEKILWSKIVVSIVCLIYSCVLWLYPFGDFLSPIHAHAWNYFQGCNKWKCMTWLNMNGHYSQNGNGCIIIYD